VSSRRGQKSDWLGLSWLLAAMQAALAEPCAHAHDLAVTTELDEAVILQVSPASAGSVATEAQRMRIAASSQPAQPGGQCRLVLDLPPDGQALDD
jgi:hypothetical protein